MGKLPKVTVLHLMKERTDKSITDTSVVLVVDYIENIVGDLTVLADRISTLNKRKSIMPSDIIVATERLEQRRGKI